MFTISPSLYSADLLDLGTVVRSLQGFEHLHLDIDDGNFVRGISFGMDLVAPLSKITDIPLDAHLEVLHPMDYVAPCARPASGRSSPTSKPCPSPAFFCPVSINTDKKPAWP